MKTDCVGPRLERFNNMKGYTIVNAYSVKPKAQKVSVQRYEIREYELGRSPYFRRRKDGYNPKIICGVLSGHGVPKWMQRKCDQLNGLK